MIYYVLCFAELPGFLVVNNVINSLMEMTIIPLAFISRKSWCRRSSISGICFIIAGVISIICALLELKGTEEADMTIRWLSFIGRAVMSILVALMYVYSAELYPTVVRNCGLGFCSIFGRIGGMLGPQIFKFSRYSICLPGIMVGVITILGGILSFSLPETNQAPLLETLEEAESFYSGKKFDQRTTSKLGSREIVVY